MRILGLLMALAFALTACGGEEPKVHTAPDGDRFNDADVAFATHMLQHHAQALVLVDMLQGRDVSPGLTALSEDILTSQTAEIETMTTWLTDWDRPVPSTMRDHVNAGHGDENGDHGDHEVSEDTGAGMPGMLSAEQLEELEAAKGAAFETAWADAMIEHHEGAVEMARDQQEDGLFPPAIELAGQVVEAQEQEIETLEGLR